MYRLIRPWILLAALTLPAPAARADLLFMKDGFILQGKVMRESVTEFDSVAKEMYIVPKGFFLIDDGPRRVYYSTQQVRIVERLSPPVEEVIPHKSPIFGIFRARDLPPLLEVLEAPDFDAKWQREFYFRSGPQPLYAAKVGLRQHLGLITPSYVRVDAITKFAWSCAYLTREVGPDKIHKLLSTHPDFQNLSKLRPAAAVARRMRLCDFYAQTGWYDRADKELDSVLADYPDQKTRVSAAREALQKMRIRDGWEEIKRWHAAGRHEAVRKRLPSFPTNNVPPKIVADAREMRDNYVQTDALLAEARQALIDCAKDPGDDRHKYLAEAAALIRNELHPDNVERLDAFLGQVREAARRKKGGSLKPLRPAELLALAVSGWLLGSPSAEAKTDAAVSLWKTRAMIQDYLREPIVGERKRILAIYLKTTSPRVDVDEIAQIIDHMPPTLPAANTSTETVACQTGNGRARVTYHLKLPPEYTHNRSYPVLIVLNREGEKPPVMIDRWAAAAADNGYILAAPQWEQGISAEYGYTQRENDAVLETLRDLRRRYSVDSDRVFLFGLSESAKMAFDVGITHPDLFAGVIPMGAGPNYFSARCWRNAQYLPLYVVNGTRAGESNKALRDYFNNWLMRGYPALWVEYKGRGIEWFGGEVPTIFDWMRHKKRAFPLKQLGTDGAGTSFGNELCTMRQDDNRFWWLSTENIAPACVTTYRNWSSVKQPASMTARIDTESNTVFVRTTGLRQISVWFGRNAAGQTMIDLDKPLTITVGFRTPWIKRKVTPSLEVLLEDLHQRGDRKHLYLARVDLKP
jgi:pimeloyl-ACP methyl ester carboxylesterase